MAGAEASEFGGSIKDEMSKIKTRHNTGFFCNACILQSTPATVFLRKCKNSGRNGLVCLTRLGYVAGWSYE
jgi:hypothetical protein